MRQYVPKQVMNGGHVPVTGERICHDDQSGEADALANSFGCRILRTDAPPRLSEVGSEMRIIIAAARKTTISIT